MKNQNYQEWTVATLKAEAQRRGLKGFSKMKKAELVDLLTQAPQKKPASQKRAPERVLKTPGARNKPLAPPQETLVSSSSIVETPPVETPPVETLAKPTPAPEPFDRMLDIPFSYKRLRATLLPKNPDWLFFYWDLDSATGHRLREAEGGPQLRILQDEVPVRTELLSFEHRRHYVAVPSGGGRIRVELGGTYDGTFVALATSNSIVIEPPRPSDDLSVEFAVPRWVESPYEDRLPPSSWKRVEAPAARPGVEGDVPWYRRRS